MKIRELIEELKKYNKSGGEATGYYMEWVKGNPYSTGLAGLIDY